MLYTQIDIEGDWLARFTLSMSTSNQRLLRSIPGQKIDNYTWRTV